MRFSLVSVSEPNRQASGFRVPEPSEASPRMRPRSGSRTELAQAVQRLRRGRGICYRSDRARAP